MNSGLYGGRAGAALGRWLERRFGKSRANIGSGLCSILLAAGLAYLYFTHYPTLTAADLTPKQVTLTGYSLDRDSLAIQVGETKYWLGGRVWRSDMSDESLVKKIDSWPNLTLWLHGEDTWVFGLDAGNLHISTSQGLKSYDFDRWALFALWLGFLALGVGAIGYGLWLARRTESPTSLPG
jgi:hypothetical protein